MFVKVKENADLRREGLTVHSDVSVSYVDAILGMLNEPVSCQRFRAACLMQTVASMQLHMLSVPVV